MITKLELKRKLKDMGITVKGNHIRKKDVVKIVAEDDDVEVSIKIKAMPLIKEVMQNFPEAGICLTCVDFDYNKLEFQFWDSDVDEDSANESIVPPTIENLDLIRSGIVEDAVTYKLGKKELQKGLQILVNLLSKGDLQGLEINTTNINDPGNWDALCCDALVQCAIFGDVIYG